MNKIITVSREFGSGGREFAKKLADALGYKFYDKEIITKIAEEANLNENYVKNILNSDMVTQYSYSYAHTFAYLNQINTNIEIINLQDKILTEIANEGNAVIVGRAADVVLDEFNPFKIFIYASDEYKLERTKQFESDDPDASDKEILKKMRKIDKNRASNYDLISSTSWGDKGNYDLCINTSKINMDEIIPLIASYIKEYFD
jgi:cytidylate kinase